MTWWQRLWSRTKMEGQLERELRFHLDQHTSEELIADGHDPEEARRLARRCWRVFSRRVARVWSIRWRPCGKTRETLLGAA